MLSRQETDRRGFLEAAKKPGAEVSVVTDARVVPRVEGTTVRMQPVILLHYVLTFEEGEQKQRRVFEELMDDNGGKMDIGGTLLNDLEKDAGLGTRLKVLDRTLALPPRELRVKGP